MQKAKFYIPLVLLLTVIVVIFINRMPKQAENIIKEKTSVCDGFLLPQGSIQKNIFLYNYNYMLSRPDLTLLLDKHNYLAADYAPQDLITLRGRHKLREEAAEAFKAMQAAAKEDGIKIAPLSAYRDFEYQKKIYERSKKYLGAQRTEKYVAAPGHSQHQLGTAVDITNTNINFESTPESLWLKRNAGDYGFSLSFPKGQEEKTGFAYEPWHYRYISPQGVLLQDMFFEGSQYDTLAFLSDCAAGT